MYSVFMREFRDSVIVKIGPEVLLLKGNVFSTVRYSKTSEVNNVQRQSDVHSRM